MNKKNILINTITNDIIPNNKIYTENGISISLKRNYLIIEYNNKNYLLKIRKKKKIFYWYLYQKRKLIHQTIIDSNFNTIINYITNK